MERLLRANFAIVRSWKGDLAGNRVFQGVNDERRLDERMVPAWSD